MANTIRCRYLEDTGKQCTEPAIEGVASVDICVRHAALIVAAVRGAVGRRVFTAVSQL